jgi:hypothetical protein
MRVPLFCYGELTVIVGVSHRQCVAKLLIRSWLVCLLHSMLMNTQSRIMRLLNERFSDVCLY